MYNLKQPTILTFSMFKTVYICLTPEKLGLFLFILTGVLSISTPRKGLIPVDVLPKLVNITH